MATENLAGSPFQCEHHQVVNFGKGRTKYTVKDGSTLGYFATPTLLVSSKNNHSNGILPSARHSRSRSAPEDSFKTLKSEIASMDSQVTDMNKRLKIDRYISHTLEKEESPSTAPVNHRGRRTITSGAKELIEEISFLQEEIADLEQYVLTLYRGFFNKCLSQSPSIYGSKHKSEHLAAKTEDTWVRSMKSPQQDPTPQPSPRRMPSDDTTCTLVSSSTNLNKVASSLQSKMRHASTLCESLDAARHCHVPITQSQLPNPVNDVGARHGQVAMSPSPQTPKVQELMTVKSILSLEDDSPRPLKDYLTESPNQLSEDLVRCMANIYFKLSMPPPVSSFGVLESPISCTSSTTSLSSIHGMFSDGWSPGSRTDPSYDAPLVNPFQVKGNHGRTGAYGCMIEVPHICMDKDRLNGVARMLRNFR